MRKLPLKNIILYIAAFFSFFVFLGIHLQINTEASDSSDSIYSISRQINYGFTLQNRSNRLLEKAEFWTYAPVKQTSYQCCLDIEASHKYELIIDDLGNQVLHFTFNNLPPFDTKIVNISAKLELSETSGRVAEKDLHIYLGAQENIESDHPEIYSLAMKLKSEEVLNTAKNIFDWVADNMEYSGYISNDRGALYALRNKKGDCTEFMYIFIALSRANDIPARGIGGYVCSENAILKPNEYHNWAEFYEDNVWKIADPQRNIFSQNQSHYIAMRIIGGESTHNPLGDNHRFRFSGEGLEVKMNE